MSRVTAIISALVICIIVCLSWAVNHYRDNAITYKAQYHGTLENPVGECKIIITARPCVSSYADAKMALKDITLPRPEAFRA